VETAFTELVGCRVPLQQAGMGGTAGPELAIAVAEAGALGMLGLAGVPLGVVTALVEQVASSTSGVFGANFLMPFLDRDAVVTAAEKARMVEFFYGDPDSSLVSLVHEQGSLACWQVGSVGEAAAARDAGCDVVVVQGSEAGGHVRGEVGLLPLLEQVLDSLDIPVIAAGGIGGPRAVAGVLAAGAAAARVGTRFVAANEADTHDDYAKALIAAEPEATQITTTFSAEWPDAPHRVLRSSIAAANANSKASVAEIEYAGGPRVEVPRLSVISPVRTARGDVGAMAHYAGQSVGMVRSRQPATEIVRELFEGAERILAQQLVSRGE
jgi:nitronate monooxygenase